MTPSAILVAARALIPTEAEWEREADDGERYEWDGDDRVLVARCAGNAVCEAASHIPVRPLGADVRAQCYLRAAIFGGQHPFARTPPIKDIARWNDAPGRTLAEVHAAFDLAADMALTNGE